MKKTQWMLYTKRADFNELAARFSISPVLARIMINRGVPPEEIGTYLHGTLDDLPDPGLMKDLDRAAEILIRKRDEGKSVRVIGDYDIDGICATYILTVGFRSVGIRADYDIPDRIRDGYGLNVNLIRKADEDGIDTIVTCDNGIAAIDEIRAAKDLGMTVIVTDHHEVGHDENGAEKLPPADAVADPKQEACSYPFDGICGAVVAWKLVGVLYGKCGIPEEKWREFLPFAAIATVGDVMPLREENRIIVREGLKAVAATDNPGLCSLMELCGLVPSEIVKRKTFEALTPVFPDDRIRLDYNGAPVSLRIVDLFSPIGKGQRGMIVSPPKAGKTTLLKQIAKRISVAYPDIHLLVLLIDERPEEVTDIKESIVAKNAEVIYSTFDELPEHHKRVSEMVIERAKRMVESGMDVVILLDSLTRLARAYNLTVTPSGRTLSGGLDPAALHMPKKFFGAARNMREGGSLTILATALIETGSRMDDVVFEEFKGTGNMELVLNRSLSERRVFPAIDIAKSGTRRDDLLLSNDEREVLDLLHQQLRGAKAEEATEEIIKLFGRTRNNMEFLDFARKMFSRNLR